MNVSNGIRFVLENIKCEKAAGKNGLVTDALKVAGGEFTIIYPVTIEKKSSSKLQSWKW